MHQNYAPPTGAVPQYEQTGNYGQAPNYGEATGSYQAAGYEQPQVDAAQAGAYESAAFERSASAKPQRISTAALLGGLGVLLIVGALGLWWLTRGDDSSTSGDTGDTAATDTGTDGDTGTVTPAPVDGSCLLYTSPSPRDATLSRMPSSA